MTEVVALQQAIFGALAGYPGLSDLVGTRVYADLAPAGAVTPFVVWQEISLVDVGNDLSGSVDSDGLENYRIQATSWADGAKAASICRAIDHQVRKAMIAASFKTLRVDTRALPFEPDTKRCGHQTDFSVWLKT